MDNFKFKEKISKKPRLLSLGFLEGIEEAIPGILLVKSFQKILLNERFDKKNTEEEQILTQVVLYSIQGMNYSEYKIIEPYLFSYDPKSPLPVPIVSPIEMSLEEFQMLRERPEEFFKVEACTIDERSRQNGND